jgi:hypothetical protein
VTAWTVMLAAGMGSYLLRISLVGLFSGAPPRALERLARHVVPAAFAGLAATSLSQGVGSGTVEVVPPLAAVAVTIAVARRISTRVALAAGLPTLWVASALVHAA